MIFLSKKKSLNSVSLRATEFLDWVKSINAEVLPPTTTKQRKKMQAKLMHMKYLALNFQAYANPCREALYSFSCGKQSKMIAACWLHVLLYVNGGVKDPLISLLAPRWTQLKILNVNGSHLKIEFTAKDIFYSLSSINPSALSQSLGHYRAFNFHCSPLSLSPACHFSLSLHYSTITEHSNIKISESLWTPPSTIQTQKFIRSTHFNQISPNHLRVHLIWSLPNTTKSMTHWKPWGQQAAIILLLLTVLKVSHCSQWSLTWNTVLSDHWL